MSKLPKANKNLGQHFLNDSLIIDKITSDHAEKCSAILEVGPGPAILTKNLVALKKPLALIEKDQRMIKYLEENIADGALFLGDALDFEESEILKLPSFEKNDTWLVSNLPYNVATPLIVKFMQWKSIQYMTLMVQKEVGLKILGIGKKGKTEMSSLHALCSALFKLSNLCEVPPHSFDPPPRVDSLVVSFERLEQPKIEPSEFKSFEKFLRSLFMHRRKQVFNVLKSQYPEDKIKEAFETHHIPLSARAESFSEQAVHLLYNELVKKA